MKRIGLNGVWRVRDSEGEHTLSGTVPGVVQADLVREKILPHPYIGTNEDLFVKIEDKEWIYEREFKFEEELSEKERVELVFEGIDTLSDVYLNGVYIGSTENMFLEYRFDIKRLLKKENHLRVVIKSPVRIPKTLEQNYGVLGGPEDSIRGYIRKAQYSYGWDWGARIVTSGIWKPVYLEIYEDARLQDSTAYILSIDGKDAIVKVNGFVYGEGNLSVEVIVNNEKLGNFQVFERNGEKHFEGTIKLKNVKLWYPWNVGEPHLYNFIFVLKNSGKEIYREEKRIGLRRVRILQEPDEEGKTFIFEINGEKVFAKGANWIPSDNILTWLKDEDYEKLIKMARDANMNMLRVWGGGIYENETFYRLCDELGIMVWQDFMYACLEYPDHLPWFRKIANDEARKIVRKLRYHPSIVLWCGNNENNWGFDEWGNMARKVDGINLGNRLYLFDFPKICAQEDPATPYWPSSPYGGEKANSEKEGDRHVWNVWSGWINYDHYEKDTGRFISEFGFQGAPHMKTIEFFSKPEERDVFHPVMLKHNKQIEGQERLIRFIFGNFGKCRNFEDFVYLSQINQAEAIKFGVEHWRSRKYKTAGTLFWQLNDSWPVFSWSAVDYFKRPKALYYYAKRFFTDVLPVVKKNDDRVVLLVVSDLRKSKKAKVRFSAYDFFGKQMFENFYEINLPPDSVTIVDKVSSPIDFVFFAEVEIEGSVFRNYKLFKKWREVNLTDPKLSVRDHDETLEIVAENPAFGIKILSEEIPEDDFIFLEPGKSFIMRKPEGFFGVRSLYDYLK
ncbi:glycoside hydrolase family 2 protein [Thermotoga sp. KOL6]|uniref:glycoside hydrolase family 2 protein n=1 Tax=Thermotoga sp. KOL6 TaxID=126741 RepID=UPI000C76F993|nr:sugar-binding domain-containing protein [Thermotoga sp. KOL6]PLV60276.1 glycosyl hydrolase family 2 [Thermotoga sp. KOL6]